MGEIVQEQAEHFVFDALHARQYTVRPIPLGIQLWPAGKMMFAHQRHKCCYLLESLAQAEANVRWSSASELACAARSPYSSQSSRYSKRQPLQPPEHPGTTQRGTDLREPGKRSTSPTGRSTPREKPLQTASHCSHSSKEREKQEQALQECQSQDPTMFADPALTDGDVAQWCAPPA